MIIEVGFMSESEFTRGCGHGTNSNYCFGPNEPQHLGTIPLTERSSRVLMDEDLCIVDKSFFFIRGCIDLPILGTSNRFRWLVWVSISEKTLNRACEVWESTGRESEPPYFGWLNTALPYTPETVGLKTNIHTQPVGIRPLIELEPTNHPLSLEQGNGISQERAEQLAKLIKAEWIG